MTTKQNVYGEGNYEASREYNEATKKFVESGRVEAAARAAAPTTPQEATEMKQAEQAALLRAKDKPKGPSRPIDEPDMEGPKVHEPKRDPRLPDDIEVSKVRHDNGPDSP